MVIKRAKGEEYDKAVEAAWNASVLRARIEDISSPEHRLGGRMQKRSSWELTSGDEEEEPSTYEDRRVIQYLLEYLEIDSVEKRFSELLGKTHTKETRNNGHLL